MVPALKRRTTKSTADASPAFATRRLRRPTLLVLLLVALGLLGWLLNAPGIWLHSLAERSLRQQDPIAALEWVDRALKWSPQDAHARQLGARAMLQLNMTAAAQEWLEQASQLDAPLVDVAALQLVISAQRGDSQAAEQLMNWSEPTPLPSEAYEAIIRCAQYDAQLDRAELILDQFEQTGVVPSVVSYHRGRQHELRGDLAAAVEHYVTSHRQQPAMVRGAFRAGVCLYRLREFAQAEAMFKQAQRAPYALLARIESANCLWEQNNLDAAHRQIKTCIDFDPYETHMLYVQLDEYVDIDRAALVAARIADAQADSSRSLEMAERVLTHNQREFEARALQIKHLRLLGRVSEAEQAAQVQSQMIANRQRCRQLRLELEDHPDDLDRLHELAELYWLTESDAESQLVIQDILKLDPDSARALALLAKIQAPRSEL